MSTSANTALAFKNLALLLVAALLLAVGLAQPSAPRPWSALRWQQSGTKSPTISPTKPETESPTKPITLSPTTPTASPTNLPLRPHIVLVVLDDVGHGDTSVHRKSSEVGWSTPNLERLAKKEGVLLTDYYTQTVCSPTRAALMTSRFPFRMGMQHRVTVRPGSVVALPLSAPTLPEMLMYGSGYETHMIGKWHLGMASLENTPTGRGFSTFYGIMQGMVDYRNLTFERGFDFWDVDPKRDPKSVFYKSPPKHLVGNHTELLYRARVKRVIGEYARDHPKTSFARAQHPLFLYMAHQSLHVPIQPYQKEDKRCKSASKARKAYCAMAVQLDDSVGLLEKALRDADMWDDTLLMVTTDNGGMVPWTRTSSNNPEDPPPFPGSVGSNYPLRGSKITLHEGGVRGLGFVAGGWLHPGLRGLPYRGLAHAVDLPALALRAANGEQILGRLRFRYALDGNPLRGLRSRHQVLPAAGPLFPGRDDVPINVVSGGRDYSAIRFGRYKLLVGSPTLAKGADGWFPADAMKQPTPPPPRPWFALQRRLLFDVVSDPSERVDLAKNLTKVVREGVALLNAYVHSGDYQEPQEGNHVHVAALPVFHNGAWAPFVKTRDWAAARREGILAAHRGESVDSTGGDARFIKKS